LYEAVAQGLAALRRSDWVAGFQQGIVKVSVADVRVEHKVNLTDFSKWLERRGRSPRDIIQRQKFWNARRATTTLTGSLKEQAPLSNLDDFLVPFLNFMNLTRRGNPHEGPGHSNTELS
jgi:hypothetical protein